MKFEIEHQLNSFISILAYLIDKDYSESLETIEEKNDKNTLINYIVIKYPEVKDLPIFSNIDINDLQNIYSKQYISVNEINKNGIENNGLLYLIKVASNELQSIIFDKNNEEIIE